MRNSGEKKHPAGYWLGVGLAAGIAVGLAADFILWLFVESEILWFGAGSTVGLVLGAIVGLIIENRKQHLRQDQTKAEKDHHRQVLRLTGMGVLMLVIVSIFLLLKKLGG
jgi:hypothetical protein